MFPLSRNVKSSCFIVWRILNDFKYCSLATGSWIEFSTEYTRLLYRIDSKYFAYRYRRFLKIKNAMKILCR